MGIIARQSIKSSSLNVFSTVLGVIAMLFVYTKDLDAYGFLQTLIALSLLLSPFASLGMIGVAVKYFPNFNNSSSDRSVFLGFLIFVVSIGCTLLVGGYFLVGVPVLRALDSPSNNFNLYIEHAKAICILSVIQVFITLLETYTINFYRLTIQTATTLLLPKIGLPVIILLYVSRGWEYGQLESTFILLQSVVLLSLIGYLYYLGERKISLKINQIIKDEKFRELVEYATFGILGAVGSKIVLSIDTVSLASYVSPEEVGVYRILVFAALVINIPFRSLVRLTMPSLSKHIAADDVVQIEELYRRTSRILSFLGIVLFTGIYISLYDILALTGKPNVFVGGLITFAFLGLGRLFDLSNSINGQIISLSDMYKYNLVLILLLAVLNIVLNWFFIAQLSMGMFGAALATCLSLAVFNLFKTVIVYVRFNIQPFQFAQLLFLGFGALLILFWTIIPLNFHPVINILLRSAVSGGLFALFVMTTNFLPDLRGASKKVLEKFSKLI